LILPLYDAAGRLASLHARAADGGPGMPKGLSPAGHGVAGLVMADRLARLLLADEALGDGTSPSEAVRQRDLIVVEGAPDFLTWATRFGDSAEGAPAVIGIISGGWTTAIAARVPTGTCVVVRTHADLAGAKYALRIRETLIERCTVRVINEGER
jgi:hypothetical protein